MRTIRTLLSLLLTVVAVSLLAQNPVQFTVSQKQVSPTEVDVVFTGKIASGWHVYSTGLPDGGPITASLTTEVCEGAKEQGKLKAQGKEISNFDKMFDMNVRYFENAVTFVQRYQITGKTYHIKGFLEYGACNDQSCLPPTEVEFDYQGEGKEMKEEMKDEKGEMKEEKGEVEDDDGEEVKADSVAIVPAMAPLDSAEVNNLWKPVIKELQTFGGNQHQSRSWLYIFLMGFLGGLIALFTPCVWPIIPMTVSFFLKRAKDDKKKGIKDAITYGISIVVIYLTLGLAITALFGASALNALSTNAVFNIFFCLLLIVFALSFFGWFELTLPASWSNKVDQKASSTSGLLSTHLCCRMK